MNIRDRARRKKGFTLAEMLIVVGIIGALAAFSFVAVAQHQRSLKQTEMDEIAREIFVAAQNHLTESKSSGEWDKLYEKNKDDENYYGKSFTLPASDTTSNNDGFDHDWRRIVYTPSATDVPEAYNIMLPDNSIDPTVQKDGSYIIEYDALNANVYSIFYSDSDKFTDFETDVSTLDSNGGRENKSNRLSCYTDNKIAAIIGYYGAGSGGDVEGSGEDATSEEDVLTSEEPTIQLLNEERLLLIVRDNNDPATSDLTITLFNADSGESAQLDNDDAIVSSDGKQYVFILDSVVDDGKHFIEQYCKDFDNDGDIDFELGCNVYAEAYATVNKDGKTAESKTVQSETRNSLFADGSSKTNAQIENGRHLENLSTNISGITTVQNATITTNIIWTASNDSSSFVTNIEYENETYLNKSNSEAVKIDFYSSDSSTGSDKVFYGIINSNLKTLSGKNSTVTLSNFQIEKESNSAVKGTGLVAETDHSFRVFNLNLENFQSGKQSTSNSAALIGFIKDNTDKSAFNVSISNVTVSDSTVDSTSSSTDAGMLVGSMSTENGILLISGCSISGTSNTVNGASDDSSIGGLVGYIQASKCIISNSTISNESIIASGKSDAGGLIGLANTNVLSITNDNITGTISVTGGTAGGYCGNIQNGNVNFVSCKIADTAKVTAKATNTAAGGWVGSIRVNRNESDDHTVKLNKCNTYSPIIVTSDISGSDCGGYIGSFLSGSLQITNCSVKGTENTGTTTTANQDNGINISIKGGNSAGFWVGKIRTMNSDSKLSLKSVTLKGLSFTCNNLTLSSSRYAGCIIGQYDLYESTKKEGSSLNISNVTTTINNKLAVSASSSANDASCGSAFGVIKDPAALTLTLCPITAKEIEIGITGTTDKKDYSAGGYIGIVRLSESSIAGTTLKIDQDNVTAETLNVHAGGNGNTCSGGYIGSMILNSKGSNVPSVTLSNSEVNYSESASIGKYTNDNTDVVISDVSGGYIGNIIASNINPTINITDCQICATGSEDGQKLNVNAQENAGGFIGLIENHASAEIDGCSVGSSNEIVNVTSSDYAAGGFVGFIGKWNDNSTGYVKLTINNSYINGGSTGLVKSENGPAGGFFGKAYIDGSSQNVEDNDSTTYYANFENDYASILVESDSADSIGVGGFGGETQYAVTIKSCYAGGRTSSGTYEKSPYDRNVYSTGEKASAGGFIGISKGSESLNVNINDSYTTCSVNNQGGSDTYSGGFVGYSDEYSTIGNCYCTGLVTVSDSTAGIFSGSYNGSIPDTLTNHCIANLTGNIDKVDGNDNLCAVAETVKIDGSMTASGLVQVSDSSTDEEEDGDPFDTVLGNYFPYKTLNQLNKNSTITKHVGDWPTAFEENTLQTLDRDVAILYYERVQHPDGSMEFYYHGYKMNFVASDYTAKTEAEVITNNQAVEIGTRDTLNSLYCSGENAPYLIDDLDSSVHGGTGEEYVTETGYVLLFDKNSTTDQAQQFIGDNPAGKLYVNTGSGNPIELFSSGKIKQFDDKAYENNTKSLAEELGYSDTNLYYIDPSIFTEWTSSALEEEFWLQFDSGTTKKQAQFYINPYFSDCVALTQDSLSTGGTYTIYVRTAKQLLDLIAGNNPAAKYFHNAGQDVVAYQTMDISFDNDVIDFTELGEEVDYQSPEQTDSMTAKYFGAIPDSSGNVGSDVRYHRLKHVTRVVFDSLHQSGEVGYLNFEDLSSYIVKTNNGKIHNIIVDNSDMSQDSPQLVNCIAETNTNGGTPTIDSCTIKNVYTSGSAVAKSNGYLISNITIMNSRIGGSGIVDENTSSGSTQITNCTIQDSLIEEDGIATTNNKKINGCTLKNCTIQGDGFAGTTSGEITGSKIINATIKGNGLTSTNSGSVSDTDLINVHVRKNGFIGSNTSTVSNCHVYADKNQYVKSDYYSTEESTNGYLLTTVGLDYSDEIITYTDDNDEDYGVAGFVRSNTGNGSIDKCSFTGSIYGTNKTAGFFVKNGAKITNSYANTYIDCGNSDEAIGAGFGITEYNNPNTLSYCHSTGIIVGGNSTTQSGFIYEDTQEWTYVDHCYSAIWLMNNNEQDDPFCCKSWQSGESNAFYQPNTELKNDAYLAISDKFTSKYSRISAVDFTTLTAKDNNPWGSRAISSNPYYVFISKDAGTSDPYPMTDSIVSYGDWYDPDHMIWADPESITLYTNSGDENVPVTSDLTVEINGTIVLQALVMPINADPTVTWTSSDEKIAKVSDGTVTGIAEGSVTITATTSNGLTASCTVNVVPSLKIYNAATNTEITSLLISVNETKKVYAKLSSDNGDVAYSYAINDSGKQYVQVSEDGTLTTLAKGTAVLTATAKKGDKSYTKTCNITVSSYPVSHDLSMVNWNANTSNQWHDDNGNWYIDYKPTITNNTGYPISEVEFTVACDDPSVTIKDVTGNIMSKQVNEDGTITFKVKLWNEIANGATFDNTWIRFVTDKQTTFSLKSVSLAYKDAFLSVDDENNGNTKKFTSYTVNDTDGNIRRFSIRSG